MTTTAIRPTAGGVELDVHVVPRASRIRVIGLHGDRIKVQLAAPPVDGAANEELVELLAEILAVPRRAIAIVRGTTSKRKTVHVDAIDQAAALRALGGEP